MLRRFEKITHSGLFDNYRWNNSIPDFERMNLVYGANGSGKTSLAGALDNLSNNNNGYDRVSIRMSDADKSNARVSEQKYDAEFEKIFVFSEGYVHRSHDFSGDPESDALLTVGKRTVAAQKRIDELQNLVAAAEQALGTATTAEKTAQRNLDNKYAEIAQRVVSSLSRAGGDYRAANIYHKGKVKTRFESARTAWALLSAQEFAAALTTVNSDNRQLVQSKSYSLSVRAQLLPEIEAVLAVSPVSVSLDTLEAHAEATGWVDSGRHLHQSLAHCIFCGGTLTAERKRQIEQHFSAEVEKAQHATDALILELQDMLATADQLLGDGTLKGSLFDDLHDRFHHAHAEAKQQVRELTAWLTEVLTLLAQKRENVMVPVVSQLAVAPTVNGTRIETILGEHNERVKKHADLVQQAAEKGELHLLKEAEPAVDTLGKVLDTATAETARLEAELQRHRQELSTLEHMEADPLPSAAVMTRELGRMFGRSELSFELLPDDKRYRVARNGAPARGLSTGERTAITLLHFLEHVKTSSARSGGAIVVVDDPVSSLDSGVAMGISTYLWNEAVTKQHIDQVFLLTHNFELFRQWDMQLATLPAPRDPNNKKGVTSRCYELVAPHRDINGITQRVPQFVVWPPNPAMRAKVRSSYHHAFITVVRAHSALVGNPSAENKLDALLLYPNVLRRMLETFLAFKEPTTVGNFTKAMADTTKKLEALGYQGDSDALRHQLTRFPPSLLSRTPWFWRLADGVSREQVHGYLW